MSIARLRRGVALCRAAVPALAAFVGGACAALGGPRYVPAAAPRRVAAWVHADSNFVSDPPDSPGPFYARVVVVRFKPATPRVARQAAIGAVGGTVVGGHRVSGAEGYYYVRVTDGRRVRPLNDAVDALSKMPQVETAGLDVRIAPAAGATSRLASG